MMDDEIFAHLVSSVMLITAITSPLIEILYKPHRRLETSTRLQRESIRMIQNTPRNTEFCVVSCVHKEGEVRSMMALLEALHPSHASPMCVYVIHLVELLGQTTPRLHRVNIHKKKLRPLNYSATSYIMRAFDNYFSRSSGHGGYVTVVPCVNVAPYKNMHHSICTLAHDKSVPFIILPFHQNDHSHVNAATAAAIRDINANFQAHAPCTVGILVDRHSRLGLSSNNTSFLSFHVGVFFMGGPDDREALALGMRMSERANTSIVLFRFVLENNNEDEDDEERVKSDAFEEEVCDDKEEQKEKEKEALLEEEEEEEEEERRMDESLIGEFMAKKFGNGQVVYHEIGVEGSEKVLDTMRILEGNYDLVMVGRKHKMEIEGFNDEETLSNFLENATLGVFGDMLASREFCNGTVPVLVVQSGANTAKDIPTQPSVP